MVKRAVAALAGHTTLLLFITATFILATLAAQIQPALALIGGWASPSQGITDIATGNTHSCGIASGKAYCWGDNLAGKLGTGNTTSASMPTPVDTSGVLAGKTVTDIATSYLHTCAVASGKAYCWGDNANGQLGNGNTTDAYSPVAVTETSGVLAGKTVTKVTVAQFHTCAIASGLAYCWGSGTNGKLGRGSTTASSVPVAVSTSGVLSGKSITDISAGSQHVCVVGSGSAYCWGLATSGRLGNNDSTATVYNTPVTVVTSTGLSGKTLTGVAASEAGHTCAIASGIAYCWGLNDSGQLGRGNTTSSPTPVAVSTLGILSGKSVTSITAGYAFTCAVASGVGACWGYNGGTAATYGRLGTGTTTASTTPVAIDMSGVMAGTTLTTISSHDQHACAIASTKAYCWGTGDGGRLGDNLQSLPALSPVRVLFNGNIAASPYRFISVQNTAMGATDVPAALTNRDQPFRLRMGLESAQTNGSYIDIPAYTLNLKLDYALKTAGSCQAQTTGYAPVTATSAISFYDSDVQYNNFVITSLGDQDPAGRPITYMTHRSVEQVFSNNQALPAGTMGIWGFGLKDNAAPVSTSYCLRLSNNSTALDLSPSVAEITTAAPAAVDIGFVAASTGGWVANHTPSMSPITMLNTCQTAVGYLNPDSSVRLRTLQTGAPAGWNVSIAPTNGPTSKWTRADNNDFYDFNDPSGNPAGCNSGSDGDGIAGQLTVQQTGVSYYPAVTNGGTQSCTTGGVFRGQDTTAFSDTVSAITLISVSATAATECRRDFFGHNLSQTIPPSQRSGIYTLDLTVTVVLQ